MTAQRPDLQPQSRDPLIGTTLAGSYIIDSLLGEGGMGCVYLARHTRIEAKRFAVKVLQVEFADHEEALARFRREAEATALTNSPHVIGVYDVGSTHDGRPFMVCDFLDGEELAARVEREGHLPIGEAVRIVRQVCLGLAAAHACGVIHRDVKTENVHLVGPEGTAKLIDFGISRLQGARGKALTQVGMALGTPETMSPEQARGMPVDHRADIYAAGLLLYNTLTGISPFERQDPQQSLIALLTETAPALSSFQNTIPPSLEAIVRRAMARDREERYQTIEELYAALAPFDPTNVPQSIPQSLPQNLPQAAPHTAPSAPASQAAASPAPARALRPTMVQPAIGNVPLSAPPVSTVAGQAASRRGIVLFGVLAAGLAWPLFALAAGGLLRAAGVSLGLAAWLGISMLSGLAIVAMAALARVYVLQHAWHGVAAARAHQVVRAVVTGGVGGYAVTAAGLRLVLIALLDAPKNVGAPGYDLAALAVAVIAASVAGVLAASGSDAE